VTIIKFATFIGAQNLKIVKEIIENKAKTKRNYNLIMNALHNDF